MEESTKGKYMQNETPEKIVEGSVDLKGDEENKEISQDIEKSKSKLCINCGFKLCICDLLPNKLATTSIKVVILQHPSEKKMFSNTVQILKKCLTNVIIIPGRKFTERSHPILRELTPNNTYLLFKDPTQNAIKGAKTLNKDNKAKENEESKEISPVADIIYNPKSPEIDIELEYLLVIDGTWKYSMQIYKKNEWLQVYPKYELQLPEDSMGIYILRKPPVQGCLSTFEAIALFLELNDKEFIFPLLQGRKISLLEVLRSIVARRMKLIKNPVHRVNNQGYMEGLY